MPKTDLIVTLDLYDDSQKCCNSRLSAQVKCRQPSADQNEKVTPVPM